MGVDELQGPVFVGDERQGLLGRRLGGRPIAEGRLAGGLLEHHAGEQRRVVGGGEQLRGLRQGLLGLVELGQDDEGRAHAPERPRAVVDHAGAAQHAVGFLVSRQRLRVQVEFQVSIGHVEQEQALVSEGPDGFVESPSLLEGFEAAPVVGQSQVRLADVLDGFGAGVA